MPQEGAKNSLEVRSAPRTVRVLTNWLTTNVGGRCVGPRGLIHAHATSHF